MKHEGKTKQEWLDEINSYTVDSIISILVTRIYPNSTFSFSGEEKSYYNLMMINRPPELVFEAELSDYVAEMTKKIEQEFKRLEQKALFQSKIDGWKHYPACVSTVTGQPNGVIALKKLIDEEDFETLGLIDEKDIELGVAELAIKDVENHVNQARTRLENISLEDITDPIIKDILIVLRRK